MAKATHDLTVKIGEYLTYDGQKKARWLNIGKIIQTDDGGEFITINRHFNPAGVPNLDGRDTIAVSKFAITPKDQPIPSAPAPAVTVPPINEMDDIPF
ncbi:MAG: hypothetical protein HOA38_00225 [Candidatus Marinimicrobia bacterium]|jgi:hypothetical protein|nr:hypothetical protein [Candidatus Neomarinimicrobiota bacterium]